MPAIVRWIFAFLALHCQLVAGDVSTTCEYDLWLVVDKSSSISDENWKKVTQYLKARVQSLKLADDGIQVGVIGYDDSEMTKLECKLDTNQGKLISCINGIEHTKGWTYTDEALDYVRSLLGTSTNVARPRIIEVLTDGASTEPELTKVAVDKLKALPQVTVLAVGVGNLTDTMELQYLASNPKQDHWTKLDDFESLKLLPDLLAAHCPPKIANGSNINWGGSSPSPSPIPACLLDLILLVDKSDSISDGDWKKVIQYLKDRVQSVKFSGSGGNTVGIVGFDDYDTVKVECQPDTNQGRLISCINQIEHTKGWTFTDRGLEVAAEALGAYTRGRNRVIEVLTDGKSSDSDNTKSVVDRLHNASNPITLIAIGVGGLADANELQYIASPPKPQHWALLSSFDALEQLPSLLSASCIPKVPKNNFTASNSTKPPAGACKECKLAETAQCKAETANTLGNGCMLSAQIMGCNIESTAAALAAYGCTKNPTCGSLVCTKNIPDSVLETLSANKCLPNIN